MIQAVTALLLACCPPAPADEPLLVAAAPDTSATAHGAPKAGARIAAPLADGSRPWRYEARPLLGGDRTARASGLLPRDGSAVPLVVLAVDPLTPRARLDRWCDTLAKGGYATLMVEPEPDEAWWRYAEAIEQLVKLLRLDATTPGLGCHGEVDPVRLLLIAEGSAAAPAVRAAAELERLSGVLLVDPSGPPTALPWLSEIDAPLAVVASGRPQAEEAQRWHAAARNGAETRWLVEFRNDHGLRGADLPRQPALERSVRELCATFVTSQVPLALAPRAGFAALARRGAVERTVETLHNGARLVLAGEVDAPREE
ncbi:MAG: hypothetical protein JNL90_01655 [Planctomycetes bacterium]|nr:hypothetical protein [Planctomycetota bacterium]